MALTVTRSTSLFNDQDTDGQMDFGDTVLTRIRLNNGGTPVTNVSVTDTLNGVTLVPGSVQITPIALDDNFNITGNTPITLTFAQLLGNDIDPDGLESALTITAFSGAANGSYVVDNAAQTVTFTPTTGLDIGSTASFQYTITDAQGLASPSTGIVNFAITDVVWYVDNTYGGANGASDGSYLKPFTSLVPLNNNGADVDAAGETIFVYKNGGNYAAGIALEAGQKLIGDGVAFSANNIAIGGTLRTGGSDVAGNAIISLATGTLVTLSTDNTVKGFTLDSSAAAAVGLADGGTSVTTAAGTLLVSNVTFTGAGQAIDIDAGGNLNMTIDSLTSSGSAAQGVQLAGVAASGTGLLSGTVTITTGAISGSTGDGFAVGAIGGGTASSGGNANISYGGTIASVGTSLVAVQDRTGGTLNFTGALTEGNITSGQTGILIDQNAGTINFTGEMFISTGGSAGTGISITNSSAGTVNINAGGNGLDLSVANGTGINWVNGGTLNIQGSGNTIASTSGRLFIGENGTIGTNGITFATTSTNGNVLTGPAISLNNVDKAGTGTFNGGNFTASQSTASGALSITNGSSADATFANFTTGNVTTAGIGAITIDGSSGNYSFTGNVTLNTGVGHAINLVNNTAGTTSFTGGNLNIDTTTGIAINATNTTIGANTLTISGTNNTIDKNGSTNGAIFVSGVTSNINLLHVNSAQSTSSSVIYLKDNGASGSFAINGDAGGTNGSGGTLNGSTGADNSTTTGIGVYLENASNVVLEDMTLNGTYQNFGIYGVNVTNFTLRDSFLQGTYGTTDAGPGAEAAVKFGRTDTVQGLKGTGLFEGNTIQNGYADNLVVTNFGANTLNLTIKDSASQQAIFNANNNTTGNDSVHIETGGTSNTTVVIDGVQFTGSRGDQIQVAAVSNATQNITIKNSTFTQSNNAAAGGGIELGAGGVGNYNVTYLIDNNTVKGATTTAIRPYFVGLNGTINGIISNNTIGTPGNGTFDSAVATAGSIQGFGIWAGIDKSNGGTVTHAVRINNNTIADTGSVSGGGIVLSSNNGGPSGTARLEATVTANTVNQLHPTFAFGALYAKLAGATTDDTGKIGLVLNNNNFTATQGNAVILDQVGQFGQFYVPGYNSAAPGDDGEANAWGAAGVASTRLNLHWTSGAGGGGTNTLVNGIGPNQTPGRIDAITLFNASNQNFVLPVPIMATPAAPEDWETSIQERFGTDRAVDATGDTGDAPGTPGTGTGGETSVGTPEAGGNAPAPVAVDDGILTQAELDQLVDAAIQRWADAGATEAQLGAMRAVSVGIVDMSGIFLGGSTVGAISVDSDGGGKGWFVDTTPGDDSEFAGAGNVLSAVAGGGAEGKTDLLTVIMHELGHQIGLDDIYQTGDAAELMYGYVNAGERRLPQADDLLGADLSMGASNGYALTPVPVGTIPANKIVDVYFKATIDDQTNQLVVNPQNTSTASYDPALTATGNETMVLDTLTLGNHVFKDTNLNGQFDSGEGVIGVVLDLYADTDATPGWSAGDTLLATQTTTASGYSFTGLAPGEYIVVVRASNFNAGQPLVGLETMAGASDPDDNVNNDDNGVAGIAGLGTAIASLPITLTDLGTEPTNDGDLDADTNLSLDFGFKVNQAPVANDDLGLTATEDTPAQYSTELTGNDTDADGDTLTITGVSNFVNGTANVASGIVTFTPTANFNGTASFDYTISDGKGHTDTATATVTVSAVSDPVTTNAPLAASFNEDATNVAITGLSIADVDAALAPAGVYTVTLSSTQGTMTLTTTTGLTFTTGDGSGDTTMTFKGTLADINTALATAQYTPNANYNGAAQIQISATDTDGTTVATGTGTATNDSDTIAVTVNSVNDEPAGTDDSSPATEGVTYTFATADFSAGFSDTIDGNTFAGVKITTLPPAAGGEIRLNNVAIAAGDLITKAQLDNNELTFVPAAGSTGTTPTFTFQVQDNGGTANGGVDLDQSPNTYTINIASANAAPVLDLDADGAGTGFASSYTEGGAAAAISDTDVLITDTDAGDDIRSATITITNAEAGDKLNVGTLPGTVTNDATSTDTVVKLVAAAGTSKADFEAAIEAVTFSNTGDNPTDFGTNTSRSISVVVNDGTSDSNVATATVAVTDVNDGPAGTSSTITALEDAPRVLAAADFGFTDADGTLGSVTISGVTGGTIYLDADGAGGADPVAETLPQTYTAQQLADGKVSFKAGANANGSALGTITFAVTDDDGATDSSTNVLTVDVTPENDSPVLTTGGPIAATEQTAAAVLAGASVADVDLDARNGGAGDYSGASLTVSRNGGANAEDVFSLVAGPNFTIDGSNLKSNGFIFGTISSNAGGAIVISFTSLETAATSALVDEVIQAVRYTNSSNNPPASVDLAIAFDDGAPGGGQGGGANSDTDTNLVTVNIGAINDAPVNTVGATITVGEDSSGNWLSGMSVSDPDADPATDKIYVTFQVTNGTIALREDVPNGIDGGDIIAQAVDTVQVYATINEINATLAANNGLTYTPTANFAGDATLTMSTNDDGNNGTDPGAGGTADGTTEEDVDLRTITVQAVEDSAIANDDADSTNENTTKVITVLTNDGDVDGPAPQVTEINGTPVSAGDTVTLASGAKATLNADGTITYDPNGKFVTLTDNSSGAVNTSAQDTFTYTVTGGDTANVAVTVNGVAGPGDRLRGDAGNNVITGTPNVDIFMLEQGGSDTAYGLGSNDGFYMGGALDALDHLDGAGNTNDQLILQGNYSSQLTLGANNLINIEVLSLLSGADTFFEDTANNFYSYNLKSVDANVAAGQRLVVDATNLRVGENFTFDGSAETNGAFTFGGGHGTDILTGGAGADLFLFRGNRFGSNDRVNGGGGTDELAFRAGSGITHIEFGATSMTSIEVLSLLSGQAGYWGPASGEVHYEIVTHNGNVAAGQRLIVDAGQLSADESLDFNGGAETDGFFWVAGGAGNDVITGGAGNDLLIGGGKGDTLTGGAGNDIFRYRDVTDSNSTQRDSIQDFNAGDIIDLSQIDANTLIAGNQAFNFIGAAGFSNTAGELRFENISLGGPIWLVQGDTDGNGVSDFEVVLVINPPDPITSGDFIL